MPPPAGSPSPTETNDGRPAKRPIAGETIAGETTVVGKPSPTRAVPEGRAGVAWIPLGQETLGESGTMF